MIPQAEDGPLVRSRGSADGCQALPVHPPPHDIPVRTRLLHCKNMPGPRYDFQGRGRNVSSKPVGLAWGDDGVFIPGHNEGGRLNVSEPRCDIDLGHHCEILGHSLEVETSERRIDSVENLVEVWS